MNQRKRSTRRFAAFAMRLTVLTIPMLLAVTALAILEAVVLWRFGIVYTPKSAVQEIGVIHFELGANGRWGISRVFYRRNELAQSCAWDVLLHDLTGSDVVQRLGISHYQPVCVAAAPDGSRFAIASVNGLIRTWDQLKATSSPRVIRDAKSDCVTSLAFSPDGKWLVAAGSEQIYGWQIDSGALIYRMKHGSGRQMLCFSHDSTKLMLVGWDNHLRILDVESGALLNEHRITGSVVFAAAMSRSAKMVATVAMQGFVKVVDLERQSDLWEAKVSSEAPIAFSQDETRLAIVDQVDIRQFKIQIRNTHTGQLLHQFPAHNRLVSGLAFAPDGSLISWDLGGNIRRWDVDTQTMVWSFSAQQWARDEQPFSEKGSRTSARIGPFACHCLCQPLSVCKRGELAKVSSGDQDRFSDKPNIPLTRFNW